ncbi:succinyl-diaminopimelate desuccinylase [Pseudoalteromonas prydzensis]|uniref:Succinyl-diaminopimelate desuccinylase n=1 Tax=Pseudoalteromonas prydzensis TaxID=182141 RepID=A0ABR9FJN3_9GAMM|nr:succinyl-diaminopimelate desuccinylase [Pseudoalteromonas prydzensis]MBE0457044.1 succinyl-diaminopimelate desuccinylase [Pseudoalteromonas prydzensis]
MQKYNLKMNHISSAVSLVKELVAAPSVTPCDAGLIAKMSDYLSELGFEVTCFECKGVKNMIAKRYFSEGPALAFSGHVDVVPVTQDRWHTDPFQACIIDDVIYGRGVTDMKGGIAAMLSATRRLISSTDKLQGTFYWLLTSDEEGEAEFGTKKIAQRLMDAGIKLDACLIGEPTSSERVGDVIRNGRRGSISGTITIKGKAGHVAYPEQTSNAAHLAGQVIAVLSKCVWRKDQNNTKTTLQVTAVRTSSDVDNIVPAGCDINFNIRYSHAYTNAEIIHIIESELVKFSTNLTLNWSRACTPYYTNLNIDNCFIRVVEQAIVRCTGRAPLVNTAGGTSDGRFFANGYTQVIECGVRNSTIHQANENLAVSELLEIEQIYFAILDDFFTYGCKKNHSIENKDFAHCY